MCWMQMLLIANFSSQSIIGCCGADKIDISIDHIGFCQSFPFFYVKQFISPKCLEPYMPIWAISLQSICFVRCAFERESFFVFVCQFIIIKPRGLKISIQFRKSSPD